MTKKAAIRVRTATMADDPRQALGLLVIDEAHRAAAPSSRDHRAGREPAHAATLLERGVLARPVFSTIVTETPMRMPPLEFDLPTAEDVERIDRDLAARADNPRRRLVVLDHIVPLAQDPRNLPTCSGSARSQPPW